MVHVLSGADHLSAVVTLSANVPYKRAFLLGVRWGLGHSFGLLLVGTIFIAITVPTTSDEVEIPHAVEKVFESLVGVFMLLLGAYGMRRAWNKWKLRKQEEQEVEHDKAAAAEEESANVEGPLLPDSESSSSGLLDVPPGEEQEEEAVTGETGEEVPLPVTTLLARGGFATGLSNKDEEHGFFHTNDLLLDEAQNVVEVEAAVVVPGDPMSPAAPLPKEDPDDSALRDDDTDDAAPATEPSRRCCCWGLIPQRVSAGWIALLMGIVHGLAGPGGVLGVIPAVQLHDWKLALLYLLTFCITSTFIMGVFALVYGALTSKIGGSALRREFWIEFLSACLSLTVGIIWLVLVPLDKLDDIFG